MMSEDQLEAIKLSKQCNTLIKQAGQARADGNTALCKSISMSVVELKDKVSKIVKSLCPDEQRELLEYSDERHKETERERRTRIKRKAKRDRYLKRKGKKK